jgi:hypothetical protein
MQFHAEHLRGQAEPKTARNLHRCESTAEVVPLSVRGNEEPSCDRSGLNSDQMIAFGELWRTMASAGALPT